MDKKEQVPGVNTILHSEGSLLILITYAIGFSLVKYLGGDLDLVSLVLGAVLCLLVLVMQQFLHAYFDHPDSLISTLKSDDPEFTLLKRFKRSVLLQYALLALSAGAALTLVLVTLKAVTLPVLVFIGVALVLSFFTAGPPFRLEKQGYGELIETLFVTILVPAIGFSLQQQGIPRFLVYLTLPVAFVYLAMKIVFSFRRYAADIALGRKTLVTQLGWQKALVLHNLLVLGAFILIGLFTLFGYPWSFTRGLLLALPIGALQIYLMIRLGDGDRPRWAMLYWGAAGLFLVICYMEIVTLWLK